MNKEGFWNLIDETNRLCPTRDKESIMAVATEKLMKLDVNDILDFHMIQQEYFRMAYRNDLHAASEAIGADRHSMVCRLSYIGLFLVAKRCS